MKSLLILGACISAALGIAGSGALAAGPETCSSGALSGSHGSVTITGFCGVGSPGLTINGNLTVADGAVFASADNHFNLWPVHVTGNISVGKGAQLLLGWNADEGELGPDTVGGNIVANQPLALYVGNTTVHGNLVSNGGGTSERFYNFPIKDNRIDGNVIIQGWTGGWWGVIANSIGGNVVVSNNRSVVQPAGECEGTFPRGCDPAPGADEDASEVQSRYIPKDAFGPGEPPVTIDNPQHIGGNLICRGNTPAVHFNPDDGGAANVVDGNKIGECTND